MGAGATDGIQQLPEKCLRRRERGDERYPGFFMVLAVPSPISASYWPAPADMGAEKGSPLSPYRAEQEKAEEAV